MQILGEKKFRDFIIGGGRAGEPVVKKRNDFIIINAIILPIFIFYCLKLEHLMIYVIIFRTKSNIACNDHLNYSEIIENECFNQNSQSELEKISFSNSDFISLEKDTPTVHQPLEKEIRDSMTDTFRKPYEKPKKIGTKDKMIEEIRKGREERLAVLKEMRQGDHDPIQTFFKSMASTVATFPPELAIEAKTRVFNIISEMELRALNGKASYTSSVEPILRTSHMPLKVVPTVFIEGDSSSSANTISDISESSVSSPTAAENSNYAYLHYYNNDY